MIIMIVMIIQNFFLLIDFEATIKFTFLRTLVNFKAFHFS